MNPNTGHLVRGMSFAEHAMRGDYVPVPPELQRAADIKLRGFDEAHVSLTSGGKLSKFAAVHRREQRAKADNRTKSKMARASRKRNR